MSSLSLITISNTTLRIPGADPWHADPWDPALSVMTDFRARASVTVSQTASVDEALEHMKHTGVRSAFAIDERSRVVVGLVTAYDISSEKPMQHMIASSARRSEVQVRDIMQRICDWRVLDIKQVERVTVAAVAQLFAETGLTHVPVVEISEDGEHRLRGMLSAANIKRLLVKHDAVQKTVPTPS
jgi:CBS domain-containing protein